jgi:hypothetical protein
MREIESRCTLQIIVSRSSRSGRHTHFKTSVTNYRSHYRRALVHQERVFCLQTSRPSDKLPLLQFKNMHIVAFTFRFKHLSGVVGDGQLSTPTFQFRRIPSPAVSSRCADRFCASGHSIQTMGRTTRTFAGHGQGYVQEGTTIRFGLFRIDTE